MKTKNNKARFFFSEAADNWIETGIIVTSEIFCDYCRKPLSCVDEALLAHFCYCSFLIELMLPTFPQFVLETDNHSHATVNRKDPDHISLEVGKVLNLGLWDWQKSLSTVT